MLAIKHKNVYCIDSEVTKTNTKMYRSLSDKSTTTMKYSSALARSILFPSLVDASWACPTLAQSPYSPAFLLCAARHSAILPWCPLSNTSGTRKPCHSSGRVYCGYSSVSPSLKLSIAALFSPPSTPGINRTIESIIVIAGNSPPVST